MLPDLRASSTATRSKSPAVMFASRASTRPRPAKHAVAVSSVRGAAASAATDALAKLVAKRRVNCESHGNDKYDRMLGICFVDGRDINAEMVREGFAWAFVKYSQSYVQQEAEARVARVGIWQGDAEPAWVYREKRWAGAEQTAPNGCAIKGNVTGHGHIYHMPWSPWYGKVKVEEAKGERWFCSESEAVAAGWRAAGQQE